MRRGIILLLVTVLYGQVASAQQRSLTLDDIYGPTGARFNGKTSARLTFLENPWVDDAHYLWPSDDVAGQQQWLKVDALTGASEPLFDRGKLLAALLTLPRMTQADANTATRRPTLFNPAHDGFLLTIGTDLFYYDISKNVAKRLTDTVSAKQNPTFSPNGQSVAFVSDDNVYVTGISSPAPRALTTDGGPDALNGRLDWLYTEEIYGRGNDRAYWWSPDSSSIAFLHLDEKQVPTYPLMDDMPYHASVTTMRYPKAGDPNPLVTLGVASITGSSAIRWVDNAKYTEFLIVNVGWTPDSASVAYQVQDRTQTWLDFNLADRGTGIPKTLFRESSTAWVERWEDASADPIWLKDGSFLWLSERSGFRHFYRYQLSGRLTGQITSGDWEVRIVHGVDEANGWIYFSGTERTVRSSDVYRVKLDGTGLQRLTSATGSHRAAFNPGKTLFLDSRSNVTTPHQVRLHRADGNELRVVEANPVSALGEFRLSTPDFVQVPARDGFVMEAMMIKPPDFDPSKRYPVYQYTYGGPHAQSVVDGWSYSEFMYQQMLAQHGIIVWICDNRTASGKGARSVQQLSRNFGAIELRDVEDCAGWLRTQPYVDGSRMGIAGYSFGGYLSAYAMTHPSAFTMGIAGGPVTDWQDYDTVYTERYLGRPQDNPDGYRNSSPRFSAANLHGDLLLIHNVGDDNVHVQNTLQLAQALQKAGKSFQMMLYPAAGHGASDAELRRHERQTMFDFTIRALLR